MRVVVVPSTLALLPEYASRDDPIADLRKAVHTAVDWLVEDGPAAISRGTRAADRIGRHLLGTATGPEPAGTPTNLLVVANGSAKRTEKAPGHFDERAQPFDDALGRALAAGDLAALAAIDVTLAAELWAFPDADVLRHLATRIGTVVESQVDYDDAPYGVQYWVARWQISKEETCGS